MMAVSVGINGFGRIGRMVMRASLSRNDIDVVHINDLTDTKTLAHLLKYDSVHGRLDADVKAKDGSIVVNGREIAVTAVRDPREIPWGDQKVDIALECTGIFTKREDANRHIEAGARKVLISAPAKGEDLTVVYGVNHENLQSSHKIVSNGSCTTNCLAPVAKILHERWGIVDGLMTTVHAYTNDQKVLDLPHKDLRRARAAAVNMIPTSTGAAKAIGLVLPELSGLLHGMAVRVPTSNVSLVDLSVNLKSEASAEQLNEAFNEAAAGNLNGVLGFSNEPLVSIDYNGCTNSSTVDGLSTFVNNGKHAKILTWYDNETGFSYRMLDVAKLMAQ
jgi:glyceraldehyde 3-phosphate dehydrogenase